MVLPARVIQSSPSGDHVVVAGDDDGVKLINAKQQFKVVSRFCKVALYTHVPHTHPCLMHIPASCTPLHISIYSIVYLYL